MNDLTAGKPFHAAEGVYIDSMGGFFWLFIMAIVFVSVWLRTQNFVYPTLIVDIIWYVFGASTLGSLSNIIYAINALVIASVIFKTYSPTYTGG